MRRVALIAVAAVAACTLAGAWWVATTPPVPRHVIILSMDTTRADVLGAYGNPRAHTPHLDALAAEAVLFEHHYSAAPTTLASHTALMTGDHPHTHGVPRNDYKVNERNVMLQVLDTHWREHLAALDHLRQGIHLRGYAQKNPKQEYKREAFELFENLLDSVRREVTRIVFTVHITSPEEVQETAPHSEVQNVQYQHADYDEALAGGGDPVPAAAQQPAQAGPKIGRNDPCPCGSGKKYKRCHGK